MGKFSYFPPSNFSCDLKDNPMHHSSKPVLSVRVKVLYKQVVYGQRIDKCATVFV